MAPVIYHEFSPIIQYLFPLILKSLLIVDRSVTMHHGPHDFVPETSSPGLKFFKRFLPAMDSARDADDQIHSLFTPQCSNSYRQ